MAAVRRVMLLCIFLAAVFSISEQVDLDNQGNNNKFGGAGQPPKQDIHEHVQRPHIRPIPLKIANHPACSADVKALCSPNLAINNFAVLECLQNDEKGFKSISSKCQHVVWEYKRNLTKDMRFDEAASEVCKTALQQLPECNSLPEGVGHRIGCLIEHKDNVTGSGCKQFLTKMASIVFSDYRLIYKFVETCNKDISDLHCGRTESGVDNPHSQGKTVQCLSDHLHKLNEDCKHEILRIAELQADDYHLDRPLYYACREDREHFCEKVTAGAGKIYKCLLKHKFEREMSVECREQLVMRQKLMQEDYKVNKALLIACRHDIRSHHCLRGDVPRGKFAKMSHVLMCLEGVIREGKETVAPECVTELNEMRRSLMEDYKISPELVTACSNEINSHCREKIALRGGGVLHCLMDLAKDHKVKDGETMSATCKRKLEEVLVEADVAENFYIDPLLQKACQPVVDVACQHIDPGDGKILSCLMEKVDTDKMTDECEEHLMEIQYFVSRDFKLDTRLYKSCHQDAVEHCHANKEWYNPESQNVEATPMIFSCLYHLMKNYATVKEKQLTRQCAFQVRRIMHQRAISVHLEPRIEVPCLGDLARFCSDEAGEQGKEMECLQDHLDELTPDCQSAVGNFTEDEDEDISLDRILMKACAPMMKKFCEDILDKDETEPGDMMECLIKHKHHPDMNQKCAAGVMHHQLISLKDINFNYKFKEACKEDVRNICMKSRKKSEVVQCLSEAVRNDTLLDVEMRVSHNCRKQLRVELLERSEDIQLDPELKKSCTDDAVKLCRYATHGNAAVVQCLKKHRASLSQKCHEMIFKRERQQAADSGTDYLLMKACKKMVKTYCMEEEPGNLFTCLRKHRNDVDFDHKCSEVLVKRLRTRARDYRLNPQLRKACKADITKFCYVAMQETKPTELEGEVIKCLKVKFVLKRLSEYCEEHVRALTIESMLDYQQDPALAQQCEKEIKQYCVNEISSDHGAVIECLRRTMGEGKLKNMNCMKEIVRVISEEKADIHVDIILHRACISDLSHYCSDVPRGEGRQMSCLLTAYDDKRNLKKECYDKLKDRVTLWEYSAKVMPPNDLGELSQQLLSSPSRNYFITVIFLFIGCMFIGGLFCGRVTKRVGVMQKNK